MYNTLVFLLESLSITTLKELFYYGSDLPINTSKKFVYKTIENLYDTDFHITAGLGKQIRLLAFPLLGRYTHFSLYLFSSSMYID